MLVWILELAVTLPIPTGLLIQRLIGMRSGVLLPPSHPLRQHRLCQQMRQPTPGQQRVPPLPGAQKTQLLPGAQRVLSPLGQQKTPLLPGAPSHEALLAVLRTASPALIRMSPHRLLRRATTPI